MRDRIVILDVETSGLARPNEKPPQVLQIGAIAVTWPGLVEISEIRLGLRFDSDRFRWDPEAEKVHGIAADAGEFDAADGLDRFWVWLNRNVPQGERERSRVAAGYCVSFDIEMLRVTSSALLGNAAIAARAAIKAETASDEALLRWLSLQGIRSGWSHRSIDVYSLGLLAFGLESSAEVCKWLGVEREHHDALVDCHWTLALLRAIREALPAPERRKA